MASFNGQRVTRRGGAGAGRGDNPHVTGTYLGSDEYGTHEKTGAPLKIHHFSSEATGGGSTDSFQVQDTNDFQNNFMPTDMGKPFKFRPGLDGQKIDRA